jgi:hypothetical protein
MAHPQRSIPGATSAWSGQGLDMKRAAELFVIGE